MQGFPLRARAGRATSQRASLAAIHTDARGFRFGSLPGPLEPTPLSLGYGTGHTMCSDRNRLRTIDARYAHALACLKGGLATSPPMTAGYLSATHAS